MALHVGRDLLSVVELIFLAATCCAFVRGKVRRDFPAFGVFVAWRLGVYASLLAILQAVRLSGIDRHLAYALYYYVYWVGYLVGAGTALLVIHEVFRHLMRPIPGLGRYGLIAARWVTVTSVLLSLAMALYPMGQSRSLLVAASGGAMRCMSVLELCLLAFIVVSMQSLRLSPWSREFGVALGLGLIAGADLFGSAFAFRHSTLASIANYGSQIVLTLASGLWMVYLLRPQPGGAQELALQSSPLQRVNEIAGALPQPAQHAGLALSTDCFLQDVEKAVDRVLEKNSLSTAE
jgi:hypothetical protein